MEISELLDRYDQRRQEREPRLREFLTNPRPGFLVLQHPLGKVWDACNSIEQVYRNNMDYVEDCLRLDWNDDLPFLEPWIGTGVYANAFGCEYFFRDDNAPHVHYKYHKIESLRGVEYPDYRRSPIMTMVLDCIDCFRQRTRDSLPIALTDTQSPFDTATLVLDATELFAACYEEPEIVAGFLQKIADLIVEFSRVQIQRIGAERLVRPGHLMPSIVGGPGISISDDNLAVSSPHINQRFALPLDEQIAREFGGLALHSCGVWTRTMALLEPLQHITAIECAAGFERGDQDPKPNPPADVRQAMAGSGRIVKARLGNNLEKALAAIDALASPEMRLVVEIGYDAEHAQRNYRCLSERLEQIYAC